MHIDMLEMTQGGRRQTKKKRINLLSLQCQWFFLDFFLMEEKISFFFCELLFVCIGVITLV